LYSLRLILAILTSLSQKWIAVHTSLPVAQGSIRALRDESHSSVFQRKHRLVSLLARLQWISRTIQAGKSSKTGPAARIRAAAPTTQTLEEAPLCMKFRAENLSSKAVRR